MKRVLFSLLIWVGVGKGSAAIIVAEGKVVPEVTGIDPYETTIEFYPPEFSFIAIAFATFVESGEPITGLWEFTGAGGVSIFAVDEFEEFGSQQIGAGAFEELQVGMSYNFSRERYIGFRTSARGSPDEQGLPEPSYSWALMRAGDGPSLTRQLLVTQSWSAFGSGGIVVGTMTAIPVPEPSIAACLALALLAPAFQRRRT